MYSKEEKKLFKKYYPLLGTKILQYLLQIKEPSRNWTIDSIDHAVRNLGFKFGVFELGEEAYCDIETTNLNADFAFMLSYCFKVRGQDKIYGSCITSEEIRTGILDKRLIEDFVKDLRRFKKIYTFYGDRFDVPFARTRALAVDNGIDFPPYGLIQHCDIWYIARSKLKLSHRRLDNVCNLLGIEGKTHLDGKTWILAATGDKQALNYVYEHNKVDVVILEKAHKKLEVYAAQSRRYL